MIRGLRSRARSGLWNRPNADDVEQLEISPDGAQTVVATLHSEGGVRTTPTEAAVFVVDSATGAARQISAHEATSEMAFSPDGQRLSSATYADIIGNPTGLVVAATDASGERGLDDLPFVADVAWIGDGDVLVAGEALVRVNLAVRFVDHADRAGDTHGESGNRSRSPHRTD